MELTQEQKEFLGRVETTINEKTANKINTTDFEKRMAEFKTELSNDSKLTELSERISGLATQLNEKKTIEPEKQLKLSRRDAIAHLAYQLVKSDSFDALKNGKAGKTDEFKLENRIISVSGDYDGAIGKTQFISSLEFKPMEFAAIRDILPGGTTQDTTIVHPYAKDFNPNVAEYDENAEIQDGSFAFDETSSYVQRFGTGFPISKNYLRKGTLSQFVSQMINLAERQIVRRENFLLLNGVGGAGKIEGLRKKAPVLTMSGITFAAGTVASVTQHSTTECIVTFAADHNLRTGYAITFANATHPGYNATFTVIVRSLRSIMILKSYTAEADTSAWTATAAHPLYKTKAAAKYYDALDALISSASFNEFMVTGGIINPMTCKLLYERDSTGQLLLLPGVVETQTSLIFNGVTFVKSTDMPFKEVLLGDMQIATQVLDYEALTMQISEDTTDKKKNSFYVIMSQQTGMPITNQYVMLQGNLDTIKTAMTI